MMEKIRVTKGHLKDVMLTGRIKENGDFIIYDCEKEHAYKFILGIQKIMSEKLRESLNTGQVEMFLNANEMIYVISSDEYVLLEGDCDE